MTPKQQSTLEHLRQMSKQFSKAVADYRNQYSNESTWQFWFCLMLLILPLILLYKFMDRSKAIRIGFFGLNIHVWFLYIDSLGSHTGLWIYPYKVFPFLPMSFVLDASLVPVSYMLLYQWTLKRKKSPYLYLTLLGACFAFIIKPLMSLFDFFWMFEWMNFFYLFIGYIVIMLLSIWITQLFHHFQEHPSEEKLV